MTSRVMSQLLAAIASISLLVGGIGIMNTLLVSVTERTREIGIRLAVGAKARHILMQFLVESTVLSLTGGMLGTLLGVRHRGPHRSLRRLADPDLAARRRGRVPVLGERRAGLRRLPGAARRAAGSHRGAAPRVIRHPFDARAASDIVAPDACSLLLAVRHEGRRPAPSSAPSAARRSTAARQRRRRARAGGLAADDRRARWSSGCCSSPGSASGPRSCRPSRRSLRRGAAPPAPRRRPPAPDAPAAPVELPAEVKTFMADLAKKAEAAPDDKDLWLRLGKVYCRAAQLDPRTIRRRWPPSSTCSRATRTSARRSAARPTCSTTRATTSRRSRSSSAISRMAGDDPSARTDLATMYLSAGDGAEGGRHVQGRDRQAPDVPAGALQPGRDVRADGRQGRGARRGSRRRARSRRTIRCAGRSTRWWRASPARRPAQPAARRRRRRAAAGRARRRDRRSSRTSRSGCARRPSWASASSRVDWSGPGSARVAVQSFPMDGMPTRCARSSPSA